MQIFINPLRKVTSSLTVDNMVKMCVTHEHRQILQALGMAIGVKAWADDFKRMISEMHQGQHPASSIPSLPGSLSPPMETLPPKVHVQCTLLAVLCCFLCIGCVS